MANVSVRWIGGKEFVGTDSTNHSVVLATSDVGTGIKPSDLLPMALATCTAVDVVEILRKKRLQLNALEISVESEQEADPPWTFRSIDVYFRLTGSGLTERAVQQAIELAEEKYCSVAATLRKAVEIRTHHEIIEALPA